MCPRAFEPRLEVFKRIERERKSGNKVTSRKFKKELSIDEIRRLNEIKKGRKSFLKELGLIGNKVDSHLNISKYEIFKKRKENYKIIINNLKLQEQSKVNELYKEAFIKLYTSRYIRSILPEIENKALKNRITKLLLDSDFSLNSNNYHMYEHDYAGRYRVSGYKETKRSLECEAFQRKHPELIKLFNQITPQSNYGRIGKRKIPIEDFRFAKFSPKLLDFIFKKYPYLKELENSNYKNKKTLLLLDKESKKLAGSIKEINLKLNDTSKVFDYSNKINKIVNTENVLTPIIWDSKIDYAFKERYGITLKEVYTQFLKKHEKETIPIDIIDKVLSDCLNQNTLLVFPLKGSLFNYYLTTGVVDELKRLGVTKHKLNTVTVTAKTFYQDINQSNVNIYNYPDIISGQLKKIFKKNSDVSKIVLIDFIHTGFQKEYIRQHIKKYFNDEKKSNPTFDSLNTFEEQDFKMGKENIVLDDIILKRIDEANHGAKGYVFPNLIYGYNLESEEKVREMLELAGRLFVRAELKIRNKI